MSRVLQSMTGYASLEATIGGVVYRLQAKSVNHRYFELKWKAPRSWTPMEIEARSLFQERLVRGSVEFWVEPLDKSAPSSEGRLHAAQKLFRKLEEALTQSRNSFSIATPAFVRALILSRFPEVWWEHREETVLPAEEAKRALTQLADSLVQSRATEGAKLVKVLEKSADVMTSSLEKIATKLPELRHKQKEELGVRLKAISEELQLPQPPETRLLQEYLLILEKRDIGEELERIRIHLQSVRELCTTSPSQTGKRLEFLAQELHREWTTLGTKIQVPSMLDLVIDAKLELDRIREQSANIA